jgi:outer membrane protein assembly factor BamB
VGSVDTPTPDPEATVQTVDTLGHAIDGAGGVDVLEEHQALAQIEARLFARVRDPVRLSRYLLLRPLGSGGAGVVYDGFDPELARRVAIKVLRAGQADPESLARARARFVREAQSIARLSHPNVIAVHDVGTYSAETLAPGALGGGVEEAGVFIVMELVDGHDLSTWLERDRRGWREIMDVLLAAGEGLAAAHAAGIVHRDFKPGNVLVGEDGRVKVVDFGLALSYHGDAGTGSFDPQTLTPTSSALLSQSGTSDAEPHALDRLTRTGALLGTPAYMAPEQHRGEPADQKADQFAFCASLYRALHGRHAFAGRDVDTLLYNKLAGKVRPVEEGRAPAWVQRVIQRGLAADPTGRFASMEALLRALRADPAQRRRRIVRAAAIPASVLALGYAGFLATRPGQVVVTAASGGRPVPGVRVVVGDEVLVGGAGEVAAGLHRVRVTAPDHDPVETVVEVRRGGVHEVAVELRHEQGVFELELEPAGGHVLVDGTDYGSRLRDFRVDTGPHTLRLWHEGYVDEELEWTARAGETERGFVALRKALSWSRPASGSFLEARWLGDVNGDGLDDLLQRRFTLLTAYDPWNDRELWRVALRAAAYRLCDVDGDGVQDVVTLRLDEDGRELAVYDGGFAGRRPPPRFTVTAGAGQVPTVGLGEVACLPAAPAGALEGSRRGSAEAGATLVVAGLRAGQVVALRATDGAQRWAWSLDDEPISTVVLRGADGAAEVGVVGLAGVHALTADGAPRWSTALPVVRRGAEGVDRPWGERLAQLQASPYGFVGAASLDEAPGDDLLVHVTDEAGGVGVQLVALGGADGGVRWRLSVDELGALSPAVLGDGDGDGASDVLVRRGGTPGTLALWSGRSGRALWTRSHERSLPAQLLAMRPLPRVVATQVSPRGTALMVLDAATGIEVATAVLPVGASSDVATTDWDGDGRDDLVVGTGDGVLRAFDADLRPLGAVPLRIPVTAIEAGRDANRDGFGELLLEARGPAVVEGPKVRWDRRPLDAIRATPVVADLDGDGELEVALFGTLDEANRLDILDARSGARRASSRPEDSAIVIRPPALLPTAKGVDLVAVGADGLRRYRGADAALVGRFATKTAYASPTVADVDGDGEPEVVMVTWEDPGLVHVLEGDASTLRWTFELGPMGAFGAPYVGDVDGDGTAEVVVATLDGRLVCLAADGRLRWAAQTGGRLNFEPTVADLDGDGAREILVTPHMDDDPLVVLEADGRERVRWRQVATRRARPEVLDVDGDGRPEVFVSSATQGVVSLTGEGVVRWRYGFVDDEGLQAAAAGSPVLADLDGDGAAEVVAGFEDGSLVVVDARMGTLRWRFRSGREEIEASPAVADVDGDGMSEVFVAGHDRHLFCLRHGPHRPR